MKQNIIQGLKVALGQPFHLDDLRISARYFWFIMAASVFISILGDFINTDPPRLFYPDALKAEAFYIVSLFLGSTIVACLLNNQRLLYQLPCWILYATLLPAIIYLLLNLHVNRLEATAQSGQVYLGLYGLVVAWCSFIAFRLIYKASNSRLKSIPITVFLVATQFAPGWYFYYDSFWYQDYVAETAAVENAEPDMPLINAEKVLSWQTSLVDHELQQVQPSLPNQTDMFFIGFAGHGDQAVFAKEVDFVTHQVAAKFATAKRSVKLINHYDEQRLVTSPLATGTNLEYTLNEMGRRAQSEDILFLYLTSHGSEDHALSTQFANLPLNPVTPEQIKQLLDQSGFRWRVVIVSACFSGGFIPILESPTTLVITAARHDRTSFGCSDDADLTYFGRAYFEQALQQSNTFEAAFAIAKKLVTDWELAQGYTPSEPQISVGVAVEKKLAAWLEANQDKQILPN